MGRCAAIGIDDDLSSGDARIAVGAADDEAPRGIDVEFGIAADPALRQHLVGEAPHDLLDALLAHILAMLGGDDDHFGAHRLAVLICQGHLTLGVGTKLGGAAGMPRLRHLVQDAVGIEDRRRHERLGLAAGKAEHDALIAGALFLLGIYVGIDAAGDVGGLLVHIILELGGLPVEALLLVTDLAHGAPRRFLDELRRHALRPAHLARHNDAVGGDQGLDGDPRIGIGGEIEIDHRVGDAIAHLVGMTLRHRFTGEDVICPGHLSTPCNNGRPSGRGGRGRFSQTMGPAVKPACPSLGIREPPCRRSRPAPDRRRSCAPLRCRSLRRRGSARALHGYSEIRG